MNNRFDSRLRIIYVTILVLGLLFIWKLFDVQVLHGDDYAVHAEEQYVVESQQTFDRGTIYFTEKDGDLVSAANVQSGYKIAIIPNEVQDPEALYSQLSRVLTLDHDDFISRASKDDPYEEIARRVSKQDVEAIRSLQLAPVRIHQEKWRYYPGDALASQVLGFLAYDDDELAGRYGLERQYESNLERDSSQLYVNFFAEIFSDLRSLFKESDTRSADLVTTIEPTVQLFLNKQLGALLEKWNGESVGGIIMNPKTGAIVAMESLPTFDPNSFSSVDSISVYRNPLVEDVFEMGSIIKPLIVSLALEYDVATPDTEFFDEGSIEVGNKVVHNYDKKGRGWVTISDVLAQSLNTGMVYLSQQTPKRIFEETLRDFGFGEKTGIDLPNESEGLTSNLSSRRDVEYANISFGQGIALTPIMTVRALSAIANGGYLVTPHIVSSLKYEGGFSKDISPEPAYDHHVISPETSEEVTRILMSVVDDGLHPETDTLDRYSIAAKTGTAQIPDPTGGYYEDRNLHSFFGYFPAFDPEFLVFLYIKHPKGVKYSSQTLADPFLNTAEFLVNYYNIPPDRELPAAEEENLDAED